MIIGMGEGIRRYAFDGDVGESPSSNDAADTLLASEQAPASSLLMLGGDIGAQVAALAILSAQKERKANRDIQTSEEAAIERADAEQVQAMHDQADDIRWGGLVEGVAGVGSGALKMGGAFSTNDSSSTSNAKEKLSTAGDIVGSLGKGLAAIPRGEEADDKAIAAQHEHEAAHHQRALTNARDSAREAQDLLERALDFYKQSQQSSADAEHTSVRRG